jgi:predicted  nucleic acid-binding Zn-ribbon protein
MDASEKPKREESEDRICTERLLDLIAELRGDLQTAKRELETAKLELKKAQERIEELEKQIGASTTLRTDEPCSMKAEEQRQAARGKKNK